MKCNLCNKEANALQSLDNQMVCMECYKKVTSERLINKGNNIKESSDFRNWSGDDLSELFWLHIGIFKKYPNRRSLSIMRMVFNWSAHANHTLSNTIQHALKWVLNIDNIFSYSRTVGNTLPETENNPTKEEVELLINLIDSELKCSDGIEFDEAESILMDLCPEIDLNIIRGIRGINLFNKLKEIIIHKYNNSTPEERSKIREYFI